MQPGLKPGLTFSFAFTVPESKTVPALYSESGEFQAMPEVFATGFMVGLIEWTCIQAINPHIDWPRQQTVGTHIDVSHTAPTPVGFTVTVKVELTAVAGRKLTFKVLAEDGVDTICDGFHERMLIDAEKFDQRLRAKANTER